MSRRSAALLVLSLVVALAVVAAAVASRAVSTTSEKALFGVLVGANELGGGDPDGFGSATAVVVPPDTLCYALIAKGLDMPVAAHIHRGKSDQNGPVVIPFTPPNAGNPGTSSGCVSGIDPALIDDVVEHAKQYYWNIHTTTFPAGALRAQVRTRQH